MQGFTWAHMQPAEENVVEVIKRDPEVLAVH
jgi:hypothetical protein